MLIDYKDDLLDYISYLRDNNGYCNKKLFCGNFCNISGKYFSRIGMVMDETLYVFF